MAFSHIRIHNKVQIIHENLQYGLFPSKNHIPQYTTQSLASVYEKYFFNSWNNEVSKKG